MCNRFRTIGMAIGIGLFTFACGAETQNDVNETVDEAQVEVSEENMEANAELNEFETWVTTNSARAETVTEDEYREMRTEYKQREAEFDAESANWDEETRAEWEKTKAEWNVFEDNVKRRLGDIEGIDVDVDVNRDKDNN